MRDSRLDVLRAVAVALVLERHAHESMPWNHINWSGVDLFFVLSGFLISGLLFGEFQKNGSIGLKRFYIRRGLKIYPAFYCFLAVTVVMTLLLEHRIDPAKVAAELFFVQNYFDGLWSHTWSLAVEEHFYIALPILLAFLVSRNRTDKNPFSSLPWIYGAVAVTLAILRWFAPHDNYREFLFPTHLRIDSLLLGVLLCYLQRFQNATFLRIASWRWLAPVSLLLLAPAIIWPIENHSVHSLGLTSTALGYGGMLLAMLVQVPAKITGIMGRLFDAVAIVGRHSYSIYLWHMPVVAWGLPAINRITKVSAPLHSVYEFAHFYVYFAASIAVGIIMGKLVEVPVLAWRDRIFPSRNNPVKKTAEPVLAKVIAV